ncbi:MAG: hypothetical protein V1797_21435 [Pseudomonadota bacterium]
MQDTVITYLKICFELITIAILFWGALQAKRATNIYYKQTKFQVARELGDRDNEIVEEIYRSSATSSFFAHYYPMTPRECAHKRIHMICQDCCGVPDWNTIAELEAWLFDYREFSDKSKVELRKVFSLAQRILYLMVRAWSAKHEGLLDEDEYESWLTYIDIVGTHPLFLVAVYYWHDMGYLIPGLARDIRTRLLHGDKASFEEIEFIKIVYPEMVADDWVDKIGSVSVRDRMCRCSVD